MKHKDQKPVNTIVFRVRAEQGCHSLMRMIIIKALGDWIWFDTKTKNLCDPNHNGHTHKDLKPVNTLVYTERVWQDRDAMSINT